MLWEHAEGVCYLVGAVMLAFLGVIDIKHKKIPMALPVLLGCAAVCIRGTSGLLTAAAVDGSGDDDAFGKPYQPGTDGHRRWPAADMHRSNAWRCTKS